MEAYFRNNYNAPSIYKFNETTNLDDHICTFEHFVDILKAGRMTGCKLFPIYVAGKLLDGSEVMC